MSADNRTDRVYDRYSRRFREDDPRASGYRSARWFRAERSLIVDAICRHADSKGSVLDLACGGGLVSEPLRGSGWCVFGLDFNEGACRKAVASGMHTVRGDAFRVPFAAGSFSTIVNVEFLQQYERTDVATMLSECARVLIPEGHIVLAWRNGVSLPHRLARRVFRILDALRGAGEMRLVDHPVDAVEALARCAGFRVVETVAICPPLGRAIPLASPWVAWLFGTSFLAVLVRVGSGSRGQSRTETSGEVG